MEEGSQHFVAMFSAMPQDTPHPISDQLKAVCHSLIDTQTIMLGS